MAKAAKKADSVAAGLANLQDKGVIARSIALPQSIEMSQHG
jgi:hypothetical protein